MTSREALGLRWEHRFAVRPLAVPRAAGAPASDCLGGLESLAAKNLLRHVEAPDHTPRFAPLSEAIREFALERLAASGELAAAVRAQAEHFIDLVESVDPEATACVGPDVVAWIERLESELDNLRVVLDRAVQANQAELGVRLVGGLWAFWRVRGRFTEGRAWLDQVLSVPSPATPARARALRGRGYLALGQDGCAAAQASFDESLAVSRTIGDEAAMARTLQGRGLVALRRADYTTARALLEHALTEHRRLGGNPAREALILNYLGEVALAMGEWASARAQFERSLAIRRALDDRWGIPQLLANLGDLACDRGEFSAAHALYAESLQGFEALKSQHGCADCLEGLAGLAVARGQPERAVELAGAASALRETIGVPAPGHRRLRLERALAVARERLSRERFEQAWSAGRASSLEQATVLALAAGADRSSRSRLADPARDDLPERLTPREREVAALVARGLANHSVAEALVISPETAAVHVKHILAKLGFSSRAQIAAWVVAQGGLTTDWTPALS